MGGCEGKFRAMLLKGEGLQGAVCVCQLVVKVCVRAGQWQGPSVDRYVPAPGHLQPVLPFNVMVGHCLDPAQPQPHHHHHSLTIASPAPATLCSGG